MKVDTEEFVLRWVNQVRSGAGLAPLEALIPGQRANSWICPIGRSIEPWFLQGYEAVSPRREGTATRDTVKIPGPVMMFMYNFDKGQYEHLQERGQDD